MAGIKVDPPPVNMQIIDMKTGRPTRPFIEFMHRLWQRTGGEVDAIEDLDVTNSYPVFKPTSASDAEIGQPSFLEGQKGASEEQINEAIQNLSALVHAKAPQPDVLDAIESLRAVTLSDMAGLHSEIGELREHVESLITLVMIIERPGRAASDAVSNHVALPDPHSQYADQANTYTETEVDSLLDDKAAIAGQVFTGEIIYNGAGGNASNTSYGPNALSSNVSGTMMVAIGRAALLSSTTADKGTSVGNFSLGDVTEGSNNTAVGSESGRGITTGSGNSIFGAEVGGLAPNLTNNLILASGGVIRLQHDGVDTLTVNSDIAAPKITASTGILFGTDTAAANTLDDYEEGTWTPVIGGGTCTNVTGKYIKIGDQVTVTLSVKDGILTGATTNAITGLPFTNGNTRSTTSAVAFRDIYPNDNPIGLVLEDSATVAFVYNVGNGSWLLPDFTNASGAYLHFSATYFIN